MKRVINESFGPKEFRKQGSVKSLKGGTVLDKEKLLQQQVQIKKNEDIENEG